MTDSVKVQQEIEYRRFKVPEEVFLVMSPGKRQDGFQTAKGIPLKDLPRDVLDSLVMAWIEDVYRKADKLGEMPLVQPHQAHFTR